MSVKIFKQTTSGRTVSLYAEAVHAGFESPAADYEEAKIDLNDYVSSYPEATFYARVVGNCMEGSHIYDGDLLVVDRSLTVKNGDVVVGMVDGEFILRTYLFFQGKHYLVADHPAYKPIVQDMDKPFMIWGVVTYTIYNQKAQLDVRINRLQQFLR